MSQHQVTTRQRRNVVLLDLDGTLTQSDPGIIACATKAFEELSLPVPDDQEMHRFIGPAIIESFRRNHMPDELLDRGVEIYREYYADKAVFDDPNNPGHKIPGRLYNSVYAGIPEQLAALRADLQKSCHSGVSRLLSKSKQPSLRRAMRSGSTGSPVTGSLTTRLRSAALRLTAEIRHDFGRPPGSNVTRRSSGTTRQVSVRTLLGSRSGRSGVGRTSSGSILPNGSSTFRLPPDSRSSSEASVPVSQFHGRSGPLRPNHSPPPPVAPQRHGLQLLRHMLANLSTLFFLSI